MTQFNVRPCDDGRHGRAIEAESFETAALAYVEVWPLPVTDADMSVVVRDLESGREQCFRIDLESGETRACA
jgi:hypothetical protein